jgi:hypothetical protein
MEDFIFRPEEYADERTMEVETSSYTSQREGKQLVATTIIFLRILEGVRVTGNLLGHVEKLHYSDHDVTEIDKFLEFSKKVYLENVGIVPFGEPINQPSLWASRMDKTRILGLLDIPHFGRGRDAKKYFNKLMVITHGGYLWLEQVISIDMDLTAYITRLPTWGETPTQFLDDKTKEKALNEEMKKKYGI